VSYDKPNPESPTAVLVAVPWEEDGKLSFADLARLGSPEVGKHILVLRTQRGWTQDELAQRAGVTQKQIWGAENQPKACALGVFLGIAAAFGISIHQLSVEPVITIRNGHSRRIRPMDVDGF